MVLNESGAEHVGQCTSCLGLASSKCASAIAVKTYHSRLGYWTSYCERKERRSIPGEKRLRRMSKTVSALIDSYKLDFTQNFNTEAVTVNGGGQYGLVVLLFDFVSINAPWYIHLICA